MRRTRLLVGSSCEAVKKKYEENHKRIYMYMKDDLQLGKLKENCLLLKLYRKLRKNVSEPQTGIEPATF